MKRFHRGMGYRGNCVNRQSGIQSFIFSCGPIQNGKNNLQLVVNQKSKPKYYEAEDEEHLRIKNTKGHLYQVVFH